MVNEVGAFSVECMVRLSLEQPEVGARWCGELSLHLLCAQTKHLMCAPMLAIIFVCFDVDVAMHLSMATCIRSHLAQD